MGDSKASSADIGKSPLCRRSIHTVLVGSKDNSSTDYDVLVQNCVQQRTPVDVKPRKEFGGPIGAFLLIFGLPMVVIYLNLIITQGNPALNRVVDSVSWPNLRQLASDTEAWIIVFFWFAGHMIWSLLPVGKLVDGTRLKNGDKLKYRCNGFYALVKDMSCFFWLYWLGYDLAGLLERKWMQLVTVWILFSIGLSLLLFVKSCEATEMERSPQGNTGCTVYDFFMGRELNPRLGPVDLKFLCELRPGLIGWVILDLAILVSDYDRNGSINWSLLFVVAAQTLYVADALWFEASILTTMDIVHEGFGFMLTFGDLAWVPFIYTLQVRYISVQGHRMPYYCLIPIVLLNAMGYYIFRASNLEKDRFRSDEGHPAVRG